MVQPQLVIRYQPGHVYQTTDAALLANEIDARLCATVFYRTDIPAPVGGRKGTIEVQGGGAFATSGRPIEDLDVALPTSSAFHYLSRLYQEGHAVISIGYMVQVLVGDTGDAAAPGTIYFATSAAADAAIPGRGAFDPSQWKYAPLGHKLRLDASKLTRYSAEHCMVHLVQWIATFGSLAGLSQDVANDWVTTGRSFGAHLGQFLALGCDRADPDALAASRYSKSTRLRGVLNQQNVSTWNVYIGSGFIPHWTDYAGALVKTIGGAKAQTGPSSEDQIDLASALYHAFIDPAVAEANAVVPVCLLAGNIPTAGNPGYTYAEFETYGLTTALNAHPMCGVIAMELALKALTPPAGQANIHLTVSRFFAGSPGAEEWTAEALAFLLPLLEQPEEPRQPPTGGQSLTSKFSTVAVRFSWVGGALNLARQVSGALGYTVVPDLDVRIPVDAPGIVQDPLRIDVPASIALFAQLADGKRHPLIDVQVVEIRSGADGVAYDERVLWAGHVDVVTGNPKGRTGRVLVECLDELGLTEGAVLGIAANQFCQRQFGRGFCRSAAVVIEDLVQQGQIQSISGSTVTIAGLTPGSYATYYQHGWVEYQGARIGVRKWSTDAPSTFVLRDDVPIEWLNATVDVAPGCDKTSANCKAYLNADRFLAPGLLMPEYAPHYQQSPK